MLRTVCLLVLGVLFGAAAPAAPAPGTALSARYNKWIREEVVYIITDDEKKAFVKLTSDAERDRFIDDFWAVRNPLPGGATNSYRDEHYRRLQYANDNFGRRSNTPGWLTDMGRTWILFGKPVSRAPYLGYGQLYPCELWFYENKNGGPSLPGYFTLLFFMPEDIGEYRFYRPSLDTPLKLVRGSRFNSNADVYKFLKPIAGDLAKAAFTLIPGDPIDTTSYTVDMSSDMLVSRIQNFANDPFNVRKLREMRSLRTRVESRLLVTDETPLAIDALVLADPIGQSWLDYGVLVRDVAMGEIRPGDPQPASKQLSVLSGFRLLSETGDLIVEDEEERSFNAFGADGSFYPFQIAGRLPVMPGNYSLEFRIVDRQKSRVFHGEKKFHVGAPGVTALNDPLLFSAVKKTVQPDATAPFQYFGVQFLPLTGGEQVRTEPLRILYSLEAPTDRPQEYLAEYLVAHLQDREARRDVKETIPFAEFREGHLLKSKTIPLGDLPAGSYRVVITLRAAANQAVLASTSVPVRLVDSAPPTSLFFLESARRTATPAGASYIRALESISSGDKPAAVRYMQQSLDLNAANQSAARYLVQAYFESREFGNIARLYRKTGIGPFETSAESLAQISLSFARSGDARQAQDVLLAARTLFPGSAILSATAKAVSGARPVAK